MKSCIISFFLAKLQLEQKKFKSKLTSLLPETIFYLLVHYQATWHKADLCAILAHFQFAHLELCNSPFQQIVLSFCRTSMDS